MNLRQTIKRSIKTGFLILVSPIYALYLMLCLIGNTDSVFASFSQTLSLIPGKIGVYLRAAFYRLACTDTSDDISVGFLTILSHADTTIDKGVYIGPQCNIGKCAIGANTLLGSGVHILSGSRQHDFNRIDQPIQEQTGSFNKVSIGSDCWLGNSSVVLSDIANHCVIAAGSICVKPIKETGSIVAGNPAKFIRSRLSQGDKS